MKNQRQRNLTNCCCHCRFFVPLAIISFVALSCTLFAQTTYYSRATGDWNVAATWSTVDCNGAAAVSSPSPADNAVVCDGHTVTSPNPATINNLTVDAGGILMNNNNMFITGNLLDNGNIDAQTTLNLSGSGTTISGIGTVSNMGGITISGGDKSILSSAYLTVISGFGISNGLKVTNFGTISIQGNVIGQNSASTWINETNSTLNAGQNVLNTGILIASASGNTVNYNRAGGQNVKIAKDSTYYHLQAQGNNTKTLQSPTIVLGNLTISSILDCDDFDMLIEGNWINTGTFVERAGTVTFSDSSAQTITNTFGETFYNLTVNKPTGTLSLNNDVTVSNTLTMTSGNVDASSAAFILGTDCGNVGNLIRTSGTVIGKFRRWINNTVTPVPPVLYPVGTALNYRPAFITFIAVSSCGTSTGEFIASPPLNNGLPLDDGTTPDSIRNSFVEGYWAMDTANGFVSVNYDLRLVGTGFTSFVINSATRLLVRANAGSPWIANGTHLAAVPDTAKRNAITLLSAQYCFGDTTNCTGPVTGAITGPDSVCTGDPGIAYSVPYSPPPVSIFTWTITGGVQVLGGTTSSITVNWGGTGMVGSVQVVENNGCTNGSTVSKPVNIHTLPTSSITGNNSVGEFAVGEPYSVTPMPGYSYSWSISGGTLISGDSTNSITVNWDVAGSGDVSVIATNSACGSAPPVNLPVTIFNNIVSIKDGDWNQPTTWDCGCVPPTSGSAVVSNGDTVTLAGNSTITNFTINPAGTLDANNFNFDVRGNLIVDGVYDGDLLGGGGTRLRMQGTSVVTLGGTGSINITNNDLQVRGGDVNISSAANLTLNVRAFRFNRTGITVTNNGIITIVGDLQEQDATSTWINAAGSTLNISGDLFIANGVLVASGSGNTVNYNGSLAQAVKCPNLEQYYHLTLSGSPTKSLTCSINVDGNLSILAASRLDVAANYSITLAGNWINTSSDADPFLQQSGLVTIDGAGAQGLTATIGETFYNLTVNKFGDTLTLNDNVTVSGTAGGTLSMQSGNIKTGTDTLKLGTSCANYGALIRVSGTVVGRFQRFISTTALPAAPVLFPIGTAAFYRPAAITFVTLPTCGSLVGEFIETNPDINGLFLVDGVDTVFKTFSEGYWDFKTANGLTSTNYNLELTGNGFTSSTVTAATRILIRPNAGSPWALQGTHVAGTPNTAKRNTLTTLSAQYCFGDTAHCAVPVTSAITGPDSVCTDSLGAPYSVVLGAAYNSYTWTITGGASDPNPATGQGTNNITVNWGSPGQVGTVQVVEKSNCGFGAAVSKNVTIHTLPTSVITGKTQGLSQFGPDEPYSVTCTPGYTYTWSTLQGNGTIISGQGTCNVTIKWDFSGLDTVMVIAITACDSAAPVYLPVSIYGTIVSVQTGFWDTVSTWDCVCNPLVTDNVVINSNHTVTLTHNDTANFLIVTATGTLNDSTFSFDVTGDYTMHGTHTGGGDINLTGAGALIDGLGTVSNNGQLQIIGSKTVFASAILTVSSNSVSISAGDTVTNNGIITITNTVVGGDGTTVWNNATAASTLNIGGELLATGNLFASVADNTVNYNGAGNQTVKCPNGGQYHHLLASTGGIKTLECDIDVNGNLTINTATLDASVSSYDIALAGNWVNTAGIFNEQNDTVTVDGSGAQSITNTSGETFYGLRVNKSAGTLTLNDNVTCSNNLIMTLGNINTAADTLILGTSTVSVGVLTRTSGTIVGRFKRWINATGTGILYPVGTSVDYRPSLITFTNLGAGSLTGEHIAVNPGGLGLPLPDGAFTVGNTFTEGYWALTPGNGLTSTDYDLELTGNGFISYPVVARTRLLKRTDSGSPWIAQGNHIAAVPVTAKRDTLFSFGEYAFGDTSGCSGLPATSAITGFDSVCTGDLGVAYNVVNHSPNLYFWSIAGGGQASGGTTNSITVNWGSTGQVGTVSVIERDECGNRAPVNLSVKVHVLPTSAISGNTPIPINTPDEPYTVTGNAGYTYTWTTLQGRGVVDLGQGTNSITIDWGAVSGLDTIRVVASMGCGSDTVFLPVTIRGNIISVQTGNWNLTTTWDCACVPLSADNAIIDNGDTVTLVANTTANDIIIRDTGTLNNAAFIMTITGNYTVNGIHRGSGQIHLTGPSTRTIDGTGTISNSDVLFIKNYSKTILATANLTKSDGDFKIETGLTLTNKGMVTISSSLIGFGTSIWTNDINATLKVAGALLTSGVLNASSSGNIVEYNGSGAQTVKIPSAGQYWHLTLSTGGTKTLAGAIDINGIDSIKTGATLASNNFNINLAGNWFNSGGFTAGTNTVTFDGLTTVSGAVVTTFNNIIISPSFSLTGYSGNMNIAGDWTNNSTYSHNSGTVNFTGTTTVLGSATTSFNNVNINATGNLTGHSANMQVAGSWTNNNVFTHNSGTVTFNGLTPIFGSSTNSFFNVRIDDASTLTAPLAGANINVAGRWDNNGAFTHSSGLITFNGTDTVMGSSITDFNNLTIAASGTVTGHATNMRVAGPFLVSNGAFTHNNGIVTFNGSTTISGTRTMNFNHVTITSTLIGPLSDTMGVAGNWSNSGTFTHNNSTVIFNGLAEQTEAKTAGETMYNLVVNNSTPATAITLIDGPLTVVNTLTLTDGHVITTAVNFLAVGASGTVVLNGAPQDSSFVKGPMRHSVNVATLVTKVYPIGKDNSYRRIDLPIDQAAVAATTYTSEMFLGDATNGGCTILPASIDRVSQARYYEVIQSPATGLDSAKIIMYFGCSGNNDVVQDPPNLAVAKTNCPAMWTDLGGTLSGSEVLCDVVNYSGNILSGPFISFSRFALSNKTGGGNPLPIQLLYFDAVLNGDQIDLSWATASEINNEYFTVEKSADGVDFEMVTYVEGGGNSNQTLFYTTVDPDPIYGLSYYRLKQTDYDDSSRYSEMVAVKYFPDDDFAIAVYPNPADGKFFVDVSGKKDYEVLVVVLDMLGKEHYSKVVVLENNTYILTVDPSNKLSSGVYLVVASSDNKLYKKKLVVR